MHHELPGVSGAVKAAPFFLLTPPVPPPAGVAFFFAHMAFAAWQGHVRLSDVLLFLENHRRQKGNPLYSVLFGHPWLPF